MKRTYQWLMAVAVVLVTAAVFLRPQSQTQQGATDLLMPQLAQQLEAVAKVEFVTAGEVTAITLSKRGERWGIEERAGYPIQFDRLRSILRALAQLQTAEAMTSNLEYYARLGVDDISNATSNAKAIRIYDAEGQKLAGVLLGSSLYRGGKEYSYLRLENEAQSWLVQGGLDLWLSAPQWLDKDLLNIPREQIVNVSIQHPDGEQLVVARGENENGEHDKDLSVLNVPAGKELLYASVGNGPAEALQNLRLDDVQAADGFSWQANNVVTTQLSRKDGLLITTRTERRETEYFLALAVEYLGADPTLKAEAEKLNQRFHGWVYQLQPYKYQALAKRMSDMLKAE